MRERGGGDLAERLDVEGAARPDVLDPAAHLCGAALRVRTPQVDVARLHRPERCVAFGAVRGHDEGVLGAVSEFDDRPEHLGDDVAGLAQHDRVADEHALRLHDILVVQRGLPHDGARDPHGLHDGERRGPAGAADAHDDVEELRVHLLGRVLVGDRPARRAARRPELVVQCELVDLHDDAVDLVLDGVAVLAGVGHELLDRLHGVEHSEVRARGQPPAGEQLVDLRLRAHGRVRPCADAVDEHAEPSEPIAHQLELGGVLALGLLPQRAARGVARIRELALACRGLLGVQLVERGDGEEHLAANLHDRRMSGAGQPSWGSTGSSGCSR